MESNLRFFEADGRRLSYREAGTGPAILCLHGIGGNSGTWEPQFASLSDRYRLIAWDMPGFGRSDVLARAPTTHEYAEIAAKLLQNLGIEHAIGFGTSFGTVILADLAASHPNLLTKLVFVCGVTGFAHLDKAQRDNTLALRRQEVLGMGMRKFAETRNSQRVGKNVAQSIVDKVVDLAGSANEEGYLHAISANSDSDIFLLLKNISVPVLVTSGDADLIAPAEDCERVALALKNAEYVCFENGGHYVNIEQSAKFNALIEQFLRNKN